MKSEYEEIEELINSAADEYRSFDEILVERNLNTEQAISMAHTFRDKYFNLLCEKKLDAYKISKLCSEVAKLLNHDKSDDMIFIYLTLLTENGLLFGEITDDEQLVCLWLEQLDKVELLTRRIAREKDLSRRLIELAQHKYKCSDIEIDRGEQAMLFNSVIVFPFLYKAKNSNLFLDNIGELVRQVNSDKLYRSIKPYIYFAVLTRKHKLITERERYSPNIASVFQYQHYKIDTDNGKNFDNYQAYLELYGTLKNFNDDEIDWEFTDYCMANLSNLSEWFYNNCEPNDDIPMDLHITIECLSGTIPLKNDLPDLSGSIDENSVLDIVFDNAFSDAEFAKSIITAARSGEDIDAFAKLLYERSNAKNYCKDKEKALGYALLYIHDIVEEYNRKSLIDASYLFTKENGYRK